MQDDKWLAEVEKSIEDFARRHKFIYRKTKRQLSASFEIGSFLALVTFYERNGPVELKQLGDDGFRYLTSPQGHPENFSYVEVIEDAEVFEIRQQVRIRSHLDRDIAFTPDISVIAGRGRIESVYDRDYANGKQRFAFVRSEHVVAAHECKSLMPFPELFVSFIGMVVSAHSWVEGADSYVESGDEGIHLGPTLFVGGTPRALHNRMAQAIEEVYPVNIILGLHKGSWRLRGDRSRLVWSDDSS